MDEMFTMDPPPPLLHDGDGGLAAEEEAAQVGVHHQVPVALIDFGQGRREEKDASGIDEDTSRPPKRLKRSRRPFAEPGRS